MTDPIHQRRRWAAILLVLAAGGCRPPPSPVVESLVDRKPAAVEVAPDLMKRRDEIAGLALAHMTETIADLDPGRAGSDLNKLNRVAHSVRLQVSRNTFRLIDLAHHYSERTGGAFDLTAAPLESLWGLRGGPAPVEEPPPELIEGVRQGVGRQHLEIFDQGAVAYTSAGTQIGLDLIGQAYAVDLAILELRRREFSRVRVQLGGAQRALGPYRENHPWMAALTHPFQTGTNLGTVALAPPHPALVVVRLNEHTIQIGTNTYGHILDPRTGQPAHGTALAAVLGPSATMAHALAQALVVVGVEQAPGLLAQFPKCEALLVPDGPAPELWRTAGFAARLNLDPALTWPVVELANTASAAGSAAPAPAVPAP